jgi:membrane protease YdiL (CAAX protease family)
VAWGIGIALLATVVTVEVLVATDLLEPGEDVSLAMLAVLQVPLWAGYLGVPLWASRRKGNGPVVDFGLSMRGRDVPIGLGLGVAAQIILVPLVYLPLLPLIDEDDLGEPARELAEKAVDPGGVVLLVLIVVVLAPIIEELFFRGLLLRSLERRWNRGVALVGSSAVFAAGHFQPLQFPALFVFGLVAAWLALRYDRLGPAIWAHVGFNATTTAALLITQS